MQVHILPFRASSHLEYSETYIAHRFETFLRKIRQKRMDRIETLLRGLEGIGEMTPEAAQELVYDRISKRDRELIDRFELIDGADTKKINRRAGAVWKAYKKGLPEMKHITDAERSRILEISRGVSVSDPLPPDRVDEMIAGVHARMPWMAPASTRVMHGARTAARAGKPFRLKPLLLVSPPGNGKSTFGRIIGETFGLSAVTLDLASSGGGAFLLTGTERGWSSAHPGVIIQTMLERRIADPLVILDEVDKAGGPVQTSSGRSMPSAQESLLAMMEPETAKRWRCPYYGVEFDLTRVSWMLTANSLRSVSAALLSRCTVVELGGIARDQVKEVTRLLCADRVPDDVADFLSDEMTRRAARRAIDLREINRAIDTAEGFIADAEAFLH